MSESRFKLNDFCQFSRWPGRGDDQTLTGRDPATRNKHENLWDHNAPRAPTSPPLHSWLTI